VDVLKALQDEAALLELRAARDALAAELAGATGIVDEAPLLEDLSARIEAALSPYFN
jgi:hypothetical protein